MKVILATMVKDEVDIVEHWINYHGKLFGYENLFIVDNMSSDGTHTLCKKYRDKYGLNLKKHPNYLEKGNEMKKIYLENDCDIFFPIDIDEFVVFYDRNVNKIRLSTINKYLKKLISQKGNQYNYFKCDYINPRKTYESNHVIQKFRHATLCDTYGNSRKTFIYTKNLENDIRIDHGNHMGHVDYFVCDICLVHYHCRSHEQKYKKSVNNTLGMGYKIDIKKLENGNKDELEKFKNIVSKARAGGHHPRSLYGYFLGTIKSYEPGKEEVKKDFIDIRKIYTFLRKK